MLNAVVGGDVVKATPRSRGLCPLCHSAVVAKCGSKVVWHWAHESLDDCDAWSEPETVWHAAWKSRFPQTEVVITKGSDAHRADAVSHSGSVIEFQHSTISAEEIKERESFYRDMVWVVNGTKAFIGKRIGIRSELSTIDNRQYIKFRWKKRKRSFDDARCPLYIDLGFSFLDYGLSFSKPSPWWDDCDDGLRDGLRREGGRIWQRALHDLFLIKVSRLHDSGYGWGFLVTHESFCRQHGGHDFARYRKARSVRWLPNWCHDWDGYFYAGECGMDRSNDDDLCFPGDGTRWCENQLNATRDHNEVNK